jgi:RNA ligase (TIGR02306 family)
MERKLATIRRITEVLPIENADNIEKVTIDGWCCVVKKGDFKEGDLCIYFEIDSFLPICERFEFLRKSCHRKMGDIEGFRLRTIKLRGTVSQGLALPILSSDEYSESLFGTDLTDLLGIIKWDPPIPAQLQGKVKGNFPNFIPKTDQNRVQNIWEDIKNLNDTFEVTIKLDGSSCTYYLKDDEFGVCSRNLDLIEEEGNTFWKVARANNIEVKMREISESGFGNFALQGEVIGEGIQGNPEGIKGQDFYLFDIWEIEGQRYLSPETRRSFSEKYEIKHVTLIDDMVSVQSFQTIDEILKYAEGPSMFGKNREGLVFKTNRGLNFNEYYSVENFSFKVISNKYLLSENE